MNRSKLLNIIANFRHQAVRSSYAT